MDRLKVGELAKLANVNIQTLRYYERRGLLPEPPRTASNYRLYPREAVLRVQFIKRAQELGFTLREIGDLLDLQAKPGARCQDVYSRAEEKIRDIDEKIETLFRIRQALSKLMTECMGQSPITDCPILEALNPERTRA